MTRSTGGTMLGPLKRVAFVLVVIALAALALLLFVPKGPRVEVRRPRVELSDGTKVAVDVILPAERGRKSVPVVLIQTRYWRSFRIAGGFPEGRVPPGPRDPIVESLIEAGMGVVVADVRGTGASEGAWVGPFHPQEVQDARELVAWVASQDFCNGRVGATGVSYEGSLALLAATSSESALRAVVAREIEWDLLDELLAPGGVRNISFVSAWDESVRALDENRVPPLFPAGSRYFIRGVHPFDGDPEGEQLARLLASRKVANVAKSVENVRRPNDRLGSDGPEVRTLGPSAWTPELSRSRAALAVWGSWWDGATADAVLRASASIPVTEALIGPWTHEGNESASPFPGGVGTQAQLSRVVDFFRRHLLADEPSNPVREFWVAGAERWERGADWPKSELMTIHVTSDGTLERDRGVLDWSKKFEVDFAATSGTLNRWMSGMLQPVDYGNRRRLPGTISFFGPPLSSELSVFGAPRFKCNVTLDGPEAALHIYLESVDARGDVHLLTEGLARTGSGPVELTMRSIAFDLRPGNGLRLTVAGADAGTFERVPPTGSRSMIFAPPCSIDLPVRARN